MSKWADEIILYGNPVAELDRLRAALEALHIQAIQSSVNDPANEWGQEALEMSRAALQPKEGEK